MKKLIVCVVAVISCLLVGCKDDKKPKDPDVNVVSLTVCDQFYLDTFYVNDVVDLMEYTVEVKYSSDETETVKLSDVSVRFLDTRTAGEQTLNLLYKEKSLSVTYVVNVVHEVSATYKGDTLTFHKGVKADLTKIEIVVLYNNGREEKVKVSNTKHSQIDYSLSDTIRFMEVTYGAVEVSIPYKVTCKEIEENVEYNFNNSLNIYDSRAAKIKFDNGFFYLYTDDKENPILLLPQNCFKESFNRYATFDNVGGAPKKVYFYLVGDTIYCE